MERAISNAKELFKEFYSVCKNYFYDSYTGLKTKRIAIAAGSSLSVVVLLVAFLTIVPGGPLSRAVTDGITNTADALLPDKVADGIKKIVGIGENGLFRYPEPQVGNTLPSDSGNSVVIPKDQSRSETYGIWVWKGRSEPPVLGDIVSTEGVTEEPEEITPSKSDTEVLPAQSKYSWNTLSELQGKTNRKVEDVKDTLLLRINKVIEQDEWYSYSIDVRTALVDIAVLGKEIRENMTPQTVEVWERLEPAYNEFYSDVYACENSVDLRRVAGSDNYIRAVELTAEFLEALQQERLAE